MLEQWEEYAFLVILVRNTPLEHETKIIGAARAEGHVNLDVRVVRRPVELVQQCRDLADLGLITNRFQHVGDRDAGVPGLFDERALIRLTIYQREVDQIGVAVR